MQTQTEILHVESDTRIDPDERLDASPHQTNILSQMSDSSGTDSYDDILYLMKMLMKRFKLL